MPNTTTVAVEGNVEKTTKTWDWWWKKPEASETGQAAKTSSKLLPTPKPKPIIQVIRAQPVVQPKPEPAKPRFTVYTGMGLTGEPAYVGNDEMWANLISGSFVKSGPRKTYY